MVHRLEQDAVNDSALPSSPKDGGRSGRYIYTQNVRQSLDYVFRGEVEAGFVYLTDAAVSPVNVRTAFEVVTDQPIVYPIAAVKGYGNENRALDFIAFVRSDAGRKVLDKYGFRRP